MKKKCIRKETIIYVVLILTILLSRLNKIVDLDGLWLWDDEMAYWGHAANIMGLSWTETAESWYSYGYSLFLLPLFLITHNITYLYRMAIVLNAIVAVIGFVLGKKIICELDAKCNEITAMFIAFVATCYSAYIYQSNIAWSET